MSTSAPAVPRMYPRWRRHLSGLLLVTAIALGALATAELAWMQAHGMSALTVAIVGGIIAGNTFYPRMAATASPGVGFAKHWLLRAGIVLYGLRLTFQDIANVGSGGIVLDALVLTSTFGLACWLGTRVLGMQREQAMLIGAGSAICGAAAVMAADPVVRGRPADVTVAVSTVVVFGTAAMFLYPSLYTALQGFAGTQLDWLAVDARQFGVFTGATVHEVAQVVAAGRAINESAADTAVITKMVRVMMLAPFLVALSFGMARNPAGAGGAAKPKIVIPWFAFGFVAVVGLNSLSVLPELLRTTLVQLDTLLLAMAMAALGLTTHVSALRQAGLKPLLLAATLMAWLIVGGFGLQLLISRVLG